MSAHPSPLMITPPKYGWGKGNIHYCYICKAIHGFQRMDAFTEKHCFCRSCRLKKILSVDVYPTIPLSIIFDGMEQTLSRYP